MSVTEAMDMFGWDFIIKECFLGYKYRKNNKRLYSSDNDLPKKMISLYYSNPNRKDLDHLKRAFINNYIKNESMLEDIHNEAEKEGLGIMYEYSQGDIDVNMYTLCELHKVLYSKAPFPEYAGHFRNYDVYLPGTGTELSEWSTIRMRMMELSKEIDELVDIAHNLSGKDDVEQILEFIAQCVILKCKLVKIHPFPDGNGRTIRCFINKLFEMANIPPVYIKANERTEYHQAMNLANCEGEYNSIINFYYYKVCDSIIELDINERMREEKNPTKVKK